MSSIVDSHLHTLISLALPKAGPFSIYRKSRRYASA